MAVVLVGTLDTKGVEIGFVRDLLTAAGIGTLVVDAGVLGPPALAADISRDRVYTAAGTTLAAVQQAADRGRAVEAAALGAARLAQELAAKGQVEGILALGGSAGTTIGTAAMRALPFGLPKVMVSTLASGQVRQYVGVRDIFMLHSVVDISGLNRISRTVLGNAARAMIGMVRGTVPPGAEGTKTLIGATMFGVTTPCVDACASGWSKATTKSWSSTPRALAAGRWSHSSATD